MDYKYMADREGYSVVVPANTVRVWDPDAALGYALLGGIAAGLDVDQLAALADGVRAALDEWTPAQAVAPVLHPDLFGLGPDPDPEPERRPGLLSDLIRRLFHAGG